ncbi:MAG TPA: YfiR family protein [Gemmatimonadaceae bacterium]|nr:YfiR family protein [Gemmatimonadaceae bacterium]
MAFLTSDPLETHNSWKAWAPALALGLLAVFGMSAAAQASAPSREYQVKAVFLFNFAQFVDWPPAVFTEESAPLAICVLGDDPFGSYLDDIVRGEQVNSRRLTVQRFRTPEEIKGCQVLFVSRSESRHLEKTLASAREMDALTVSDAEDFASRGGMIQLTMEYGKIRLKINVDAAKASSLTISSKLLRSAEIVSSRD